MKRGGQEGLDWKPKALLGFLSIFQVEGRYDYTSYPNRHHSKHEVHINGVIDNARVGQISDLTLQFYKILFYPGRFFRALRSHDLLRNLS